MLFAWILGWILGGLLIGSLFGLIAYAVGRCMRRPNMGAWGLVCCAIGGLLGPLSFIIMVGFIVGILVSRCDAAPLRRPVGAGSTVCGYVGGYDIGPAHPGYQLVCLSGPLHGRVYSLGRDDVMFGRDNDCGVRFPAETPGISRHHCAIRWQRGVPVLVDLASAYGTFEGDGRQLIANAPVPLGVGSRFYLANTRYQFQLVAA